MWVFLCSEVQSFHSNLRFHKYLTSPATQKYTFTSFRICLYPLIHNGMAACQKQWANSLADEASLDCMRNVHRLIWRIIFQIKIEQEIHTPKGDIVLIISSTVSALAGIIRMSFHCG